MITVTIKERGKSPWEAWLGAEYVAKRHGPKSCPCCGSATYAYQKRERAFSGSHLWRISCGPCGSAIMSQSFRDCYAEDLAFQDLVYQENPFFAFLKKSDQDYDGGRYYIPVPFTVSK